MDKPIIELSELRIGNILLYKGRYVYVTMLTMDIDDEYEDSIFFCYLGEHTKEMGGWNRAIYLDADRVPLTPEILEACEFGQSDEHEKGYNAHPVFGFYHDYHFNRFRLEAGNDDIYMPSIQYLHQLQNLYFALTGEELTINLNQPACP